MPEQNESMFDINFKRQALNRKTNYAWFNKQKIGSTWESADNIDGTHTCRDPDDNRLLG